MIPFVNLCAKSITLDHIILSQAQPPPKCISSCMKPLSILPKMDFLPFSVKSNMASIMSENLLSCRPSLPTLTCAAPVTKKATKLMETMKKFLEPEILINMHLFLLIEQNQILFEKVLHKQVDQIQSTQHVNCTPKLKEDFLEISKIPYRVHWSYLLLVRYKINYGRIVFQVKYLFFQGYLVSGHL